MKKVSARTVFVILIAIASIGSYVYMNSLREPKTEDISTVDDTEEQQLEENQKTKHLPDLQLIIKMMETGKRFLPAN